MTTQEKIAELLKEDEISKLYSPFDVSVRIKPNYKTREPSYNLIFPNVCEKLSKSDVSKFLKRFKPHKNLKLTTKHGKDEYEFIYKLDVSSSPRNNFSVSIKYIDENENEIYMSIPYRWIDDFVYSYSSGVNNTELHYFGGVSVNQIGKIQRINFKGKTIAWYGDNHTLVCNETANKIVNFIKSLK